MASPSENVAHLACGFKQAVIQILLDLTWFPLIRCTFPSTPSLRLCCPWQQQQQQHSLPPLPPAFAVIHHQCHSVLPFHMAQHLFGRCCTCHVEKDSDKWLGWERGLGAALPLHVWCHFACQLTWDVSSLVSLCPKSSSVVPPTPWVYVLLVCHAIIQ